MKEKRRQAGKPIKPPIERNTMKNTKVIIMKAKAPNGNNLTYRTLCPLHFTVADAYYSDQPTFDADGYVVDNSTLTNAAEMMQDVKKGMQDAANIIPVEANVA